MTWNGGHLLSTWPRGSVRHLEEMGANLYQTHIVSVLAVSTSIEHGWLCDVARCKAVTVSCLYKLKLAKLLSTPPLPPLPSALDGWKNSRIISKTSPCWHIRVIIVTIASLCSFCQCSAFPWYLQTTGCMSMHETFNASNMHCLN